MLMPKWAKVAATVLSDKQIALEHPDLERSTITPSLEGSGVIQVVSDLEKMGETVGGTVSRKGKFGFTCDNCGWVPKKSDGQDWVRIEQGNLKPKYFAAHWPERCRKCSSRMKRWTCAARNYDQLEILRHLEGRHCLRFITWTRPEWNVKVPVGLDLQDSLFSGYPSNASPPTLWDEAEKLKKLATRQFRNWRSRNKYWGTREAKGQCYYECTMKPVWNGWGWDEVQLHFHIHTVVCSKRIENKDIQIDLDTLEQIPMSTTIQREWGGIVDVRACKTWKHKDGAVKTSKRFVMNYLVDYINKSPHWQSTKFGDWSN